jgi:hypothetical protein
LQATSLLSLLASVGDKHEIGLIMTQTENPFAKTSTDCKLCSGRAPTDGENISNKDYLSSNVTAVL